MVPDPLFLITLILSALYLAMLFYFFVGWLRLKKQQTLPAEEAENLPFVTIVIPTRNESEHIKTCLESIFKQTYPKELFEVIVIDDYSTDPTIRYAKECNESNLLVLDLQNYLGQPGEYVPNKKKAIALGIKNAKGDLIVTTDGDCHVAENWLATMVQNFRGQKVKLLTGPVLLKPAYWVLDIFQQLDVINMIGITGATIRNGLPTMCNGANLMYTKEIFHEVEGFKGNNELPTGDDVLLMQKIQAKYPGSIGFVKNIEACVFSKPEKTWNKFVAQRIRWVSKSSHFSDRRVTAILVFAYVFNFFVLVNLVDFLQSEAKSWLPLAIIGGTKVFADLLFNIPVLFFFRKLILLLVFPIAEMFHVVYVVLIGALGLTGKYRWKDRLVK